MMIVLDDIKQLLYLKLNKYDTACDIYVNFVTYNTK